MSILARGFIAIALISGTYALGSQAGAAVTPKEAPTKVAAITPPAPPAAAPVASAEPDCFFARKKNARRKAASYVRLVKVCE